MLHPESVSVRARTAENVAILVALQWLSRGSAILTKVILVRLLLPTDFGVFALASGLVGFVATFGNFGLDYALVQKGDAADRTDYDVAMSIRLLLAAALFGATVVVAIPWAGLFGAPSVTLVAQVLALMYLAMPWAFVPSTRLTSRLDYRSLVIPNVLVQVGGAAVSIGMAIAGLGVWALAGGAIATQVVWALSVTYIERWSFRFRLDRRIARSLLHYARHLVLVSVLAFLVTNVDNFTVGYFLGSTILGYYAVAYSISLVSTLLSGSAASALFPSLSRIQSDKPRLQRGYLESLEYASATLVPSAVGLALIAPEVVLVILGSEWVPATMPLVVLCFYGLAKGYADFGSSLFAAVGRPRLISELNLLVLALSVPLLVPLTFFYGTVGTAIAMTIPVTVAVGYSFYETSRIINVPARKLLLELRGTIVAGAIMGSLSYLARLGMMAVVPDSLALPLAGVRLAQSVIVLLVVVPFAVLTYLLALRFTDRDVYGGLKRHVLLVLHQEDPA